MRPPSGLLPTGAATARAAPWLRLLAAAMVLAVGVTGLLSAWISDDGFVTFRTVENLVAGDGFRWNTAERTQTAAHPLWVLLLAAARIVSGEMFVTALVVSLACTIAAAGLLLRLAIPRWAAIATVGAALLGSRSSASFATGGLENPFVHLLLAVFATLWFGAADGASDRARRLRRLAITAALLLLSRIDIASLLLPCLLAAARGIAPRAAALAVLPAAVLLLLWCAFAGLYFGTVIPTPGYAKALALDVPATELLRQGLRYSGDLCWRDPATALTLVLALVVAVASRCPALLWPAAGIALQLAYVVKVGGDFMAGRFFLAPFVFAVAVLSQLRHNVAAVLLCVALAFGSLFAPGSPPWLDVVPEPAAARMQHGIADERGYYASALALWSSERRWPAYGEFVRALQLQDRERPMVDLAHTAGVRGYMAGAMVHVVEPWICDPLLTRLPLADPRHWRIGHFTRRIPEGYLETLASGDNRIHHASLRAYYDALRRVVRGPVFDGSRLGTLLRFWRGDYDGLLEDYVRDEYRAPPRIEVAAARLGAAVPHGAFWFDRDAVVVREGGLRILFAAPMAGATLRLCGDGTGAGELRFCRGTSALVSVPFMAASFGAAEVTVAVPVAARGFDAVELDLRQEGDPAITVLPLFAVLGVAVE